MSTPNCVVINAATTAALDRIAKAHCHTQRSAAARYALRWLARHPEHDRDSFDDTAGVKLVFRAPESDLRVWERLAARLGTCFSSSLRHAAQSAAANLD